MELVPNLGSGKLSAEYKRLLETTDDIVPGFDTGIDALP
jgi:hypothetical protein